MAIDVGKSEGDMGRSEGDMGTGQSRQSGGDSKWDKYNAWQKLCGYDYTCTLSGEIEKYTLQVLQYLLGFDEPIGPLRVRVLTKQYMKMLVSTQGAFLHQKTLIDQ